MVVVLTDGPSEDPVESSARKLRMAGVEVFVLGGCSLFTSHIHSAFELIRNIPTSVSGGQMCCLSPEQGPGYHGIITNVLILGVGQADEAELKLIASTPYRTHVYSVPTFAALRSVQRELISQVCAAVEDQLNALVSGEEGEVWWWHALPSTLSFF